MTAHLELQKFLVSKWIFNMWRNDSDWKLKPTAGDRKEERGKFSLADGDILQTTSPTAGRQGEASNHLNGRCAAAVRHRANELLTADWTTAGCQSLRHQIVHVPVYCYCTQHWPHYHLLPWTRRHVGDNRSYKLGWTSSVWWYFLSCHQISCSDLN